MKYYKPIPITRLGITGATTNSELALIAIWSNFPGIAAYFTMQENLEKLNSLIAQFYFK